MLHEIVHVPLSVTFEFGYTLPPWFLNAYRTDTLECPTALRPDGERVGAVKKSLGVVKGMYDMLVLQQGASCASFNLPLTLLRSSLPFRKGAVNPVISLCPIDANLAQRIVRDEATLDGVALLLPVIGRVSVEMSKDWLSRLVEHYALTMDKAKMGVEEAAGDEEGGTKRL